MKFLLTIAEVVLYIIHKKWNTCNIVGIWHCMWKFWGQNHYVHCNLHIAQRWGPCSTTSENQLLLLLPVIQFCVIYLKTLPYIKSYIACSAVYHSAFLHSFPCLVLASLCTHETWVPRFFLQLSMSLESYINNDFFLWVC
jgi:hypothetical protein